MSAPLALRRMLTRDPAEPHRAASVLELFFDLVFVVAVSTAAGQLHHALAEGHVVESLPTFGMVFFGIWWAWMNFTWFATSFDTDDWLYRVLTFVQMGGVLALAAGIGPAFHDHDFTVMVAAYIVMRVAMVAQWLRAAASACSHRRTALTYAVGIAGAQMLWIGFLFVPPAVQSGAFVALMLVELAVPIIAERGTSTPWHPHHITERYGLFTLIVLGESLLASANAIISALDAGGDLAPLLGIAIMALAITAGLWWVYFWPPHHHAISSFGASLQYGYFHYFVFAAAATFSVGVELEIDRLTDHSVLDAAQTSFAVTIPIAVFLLGVWWLAIRRQADAVVNTVVPLAAIVVLGDALVPMPLVVPTLVMVIVVVVLVLRQPVRKA